MNTTVGMLAHVDAGKTTFAEQLLYHTSSIRRRGRVDHKDAFMDSHPIERARGITVFADQASFVYNGRHYDLIDTPGHVDFSPEMERAVQVMDYAVVIISAVEGVEGHTETVWRLLRAHRVPTLFFLNKTDRAGADPQRVIADIRRQLTGDVCDLSAPLGPGQMDERLAEFIAERDEALLERYVTDGCEPGIWLAALRRMVREGRVFPCMGGSALLDVGVADFLAKLDLLAATDYSGDAPFAGRVYKIRHDENGTRITYIKALAGRLNVRDGVRCGGEQEEKVTQIRRYNGARYEVVEQAEAGRLYAVTGLATPAVGDGIGALSGRTASGLEPALVSKAIFEPPVHAKELLRCFRLLDDEDPSLNVEWDERLQEIRIRVMGAIQLEVLEQLVAERFGHAVRFGAPDILYKETIAAPVVGYGHFEPLGHYAEVHLRLEPGKRGSGITFVNGCHPDELATGYQHLVRQHLFEREHHGLLTGSPLADVRITLLSGRAHNKHTSGGDFREATFRALRQALEKADNVLLEPMYRFRIRSASEHIGRAMSDIQRAHGRFDPPESDAGGAVIVGRAPVATFMNYAAELAAYTHGKGSIALQFGGYEPCHNAADVIARRGYDKDADPLYTSSSIFCAKGQGFSVPWNEAERHMHALR